MMHKMKDVVSKLFHPSFLFSTNDDTDRSKRKRSDSNEETDDEQQMDRTSTNANTNNHRPVIQDDEPQLTDDEDNNSQDVPSSEQQKKRRRTANYQHLLSTNSHRNEERTSPLLSSTDSVISSSYTTPILHQTSIEHNYDERINRSRQRYNIPPTYRKLTSNYDPSKSPLFSAGNRNNTTTTTTAKSNEYPANHLLATSLTNRSSTSTFSNQQPSATLTKPLSQQQRQMLGVTYSPIASRRLPYIERLRQRTLQDSVRLNQTLHNEPMSTSTTEEHKSTTTSATPKRPKAPEKECGIQCDIVVMETSQEPQSTGAPMNVQDETSAVSAKGKIQTDSSITIEKQQPPIPTISITKAKVLGAITPFSWPKFARAQEEYAKKHPDKCRTDAVVPAVSQKSTANTTSTTDTVSKLPLSSSSSSLLRSAEAVWKCPCCTKEHVAQTASCSLCHGINPNYKKRSAMKTNVIVEREQVSSTMTAQESSISTPVTSVTNQTTTKENIPSTSSSTVATSAFPLSSGASQTTLPARTKENPVFTPASFSIPPFGITSTTFQQNSFITPTPMSAASTITPFTMTLSSSPATTTTTNPLSTIAPRVMFGTTPVILQSSTTAEKLIPTNPSPFFSIATTKENLGTTSSTQSWLGTTSSDKSLTSNAASSFQVGTAFQPFGSAPPASLTRPPAVEMTPTASIESSSNTSIMPTTATIPAVSTVSSNQSSSFTSPLATSAPSLTTSNSSVPNLFGFSAPTSASSIAAPVSFSTLPTANPFPMSNNLTSTSSVTTSAPLPFGSSAFALTPASTTPRTGPLVSSNNMFQFGINTPLRPLIPVSSSLTAPTSVPSFGMNSTFGTASGSADKSANPFSAFSSSTPSSSFNFGTTPTTIETPVAPVISTSSFSFGSPPSTTPLFGVAPSALSSNPFGFGTAPPSFTNNATIQFPPPTSVSTNSFSTPGFPGSTDSPSPLFTIGSGDTPSNPSRPILRARRRPRN